MAEISFQKNGRDCRSCREGVEIASVDLKTLKSCIADWSRANLAGRQERLGVQKGGHTSLIAPDLEGIKDRSVVTGEQLHGHNFLVASPDLADKPQLKALLANLL